jgi:hypothetical protein
VIIFAYIEMCANREETFTLDKLETVLGVQPTELYGSREEAESVRRDKQLLRRLLKSDILCSQNIPGLTYGREYWINGNRKIELPVDYQYPPKPPANRISIKPYDLNDRLKAGSV